jgi:DNA-binding MarR family transcriptional regulator
MEAFNGNCPARLCSNSRVTRHMRLTNVTFYAILMTVDTIQERKDSMLPSEMIILMAISINKSAGQKLLTHPMDVTSEYIGYLYNSLVNRGYLRGHRSTGYQLTTIGREAIFEFVKKNHTRSTDVVKRLRMLGIEVSPEQEQRICNLKMEAIKA